MSRAADGPVGAPTAGGVLLEALRFDLEPIDALRRRVDAALSMDVGGFLLFGAEVDVAVRLIEEIRTAAGRPIWLAADLERGAGQHFRGLTTFPPPAALSRHPEPVEAVREAARWTAAEARAIGLNLALAPVLDLDVEPANPIVGTRSFGADPAQVASLGLAWIEACQAGGVAACAKHFPGHGRTTVDSHAELPVVQASRKALESDLAPFRAVAGDVACVMTAHVAFPALGATGPATVEGSLLRDLLRTDLGFEGLVLTDALNMGGAREGGGGQRTGAREAEALVAGCDLLLYPPDLAQAARAVRESAEASEPVARRLEEAVLRSVRVLARYEPGAGTLDGRSTPPHRAEAIARDCVIPIGGGWPAWLDPVKPVAVATVWDDREDPARPNFGAAFRSALAEAGWTVLPPGPMRAETPLLVLVAATPQAWKGTAGLTQTGRAAVDGALATERAFPVLFGHPRLLERLGRPGLCAWATEPAMERAAAARLVQLGRQRAGEA